MSKLRRISLTLGTLAITAAPVAAVISCGAMSPKDKKNYTFGLSVDVVSTLNYIKYKSAVQVASSLVEGVAKGGPEQKTPIYNYLELDHVILGSGSGGAFAMDQGAYQSGTLRRSSSRWIQDRVYLDHNASAVFAVDSYNSSLDYEYNLNGQSKWANGEKLTSSNFIDGLVYILDINTGSQRLHDVQTLGIRGVNQFVEAQNAYAKKFGVTYKNPFGYKYTPLPAGSSPEKAAVWNYYQQMSTQFPTQTTNASERAYVDAIEKAARNLGVYGDSYSSHPRLSDAGTPVSLDDLTEYTVEGIQPFKMIIVADGNIDAFGFALNRMARYSQYFLPINRRFVENNGGIEKFGIDKEHFLEEGPFLIEDAILGENGNILLKKDYSYFAKEEILPEKIKLFFQKDPIIAGSLFEDGYISATNIDSVYTRKFFSNGSMRKLISKDAGFGMTGFVMNLDKETNKNPALLNPHLRKALLFAIDRRELIKISGFDATFPSYSLIEPTTQTDHWSASESGVSYGNTFSGDSIKFSNTFSAPVTSSSSLEATGMSQLFANPDQTDRLHNIAEAKREFEIFKSETGQSAVNIVFTHDSTPMMLNMGISLKSQFKKVFGGAISLDLKGLPKTIYDTYMSEGNFEMTWKNLDYFSNVNGLASGIDLFMVSDGIRKADLKNIGFINNPTGSWTFKDAFKYYDDHVATESIADVQARLGVVTAHEKKAWDKIKLLSTLPTITESWSTDKLELLQKERIDSFFRRNGMSKDLLPASLQSDTTWIDVDSDFDTTRELMDVVRIANKIIMDQGVILPIFRVDVTVSINRLPGVSYQKSGLSLGYLYDLLRKPRPDLPGIEVKGA